MSNGSPMKKFVIAALGGTVAGALLTTQIAGPLLAQETQANSTVYEQLDLFGDIFERIRNQDVEPVDTNELIEAAINGMLSSLDPHSSYMNAKDYASMQVQTKGEFGGLGLEVSSDNGFIKVISPIDDTPASRAGMKSGLELRGLMASHTDTIVAGPMTAAAMVQEATQP